MPVAVNIRCRGSGGGVYLITASPAPTLYHYHHRPDHSVHGTYHALSHLYVGTYMYVSMFTLYVSVAILCVFLSCFIYLYVSVCVCSCLIFLSENVMFIKSGVVVHQARAVQTKLIIQTVNLEMVADVSQDLTLF